MSEQPVVHSTFVVERSYPVLAERVFEAFANVSIRRRWFAGGDHHEVERFEQDFRPGGHELLSYRFKEGTPFPGVAITNEGTFLDIVQDRRIVSSGAMTLGERRISASLVTIELIPTAEGTSLVCTHQGAFFEGADGPKMREAGWQTLLGNLAAELAS